MERPVSSLDESWTQVRPVLDDELSRLPEQYRAPLVLCYLEGMTREKAAEHLGWPAGTVATRLTRGRDLLRGRLAARGAGVSGALLITLIAKNAASASVSPELIVTTVKAASVASFVSPQVGALVKGGLKAMMWMKLKVAAAVMAVGMTGAGGSVLAYRALAEPAQLAQARLAPKDLPPEIPASKFKALHELIKPGKGEYLWLEIPWLTSVHEAREKAAKEGKPMIVWRTANGNPLGST